MFYSGANKPSEADPILFVPILSHPIFPAKIRKFFRFGVPQESFKRSTVINFNDKKLLNLSPNEMTSEKEIPNQRDNVSDSLI